MPLGSTLKNRTRAAGFTLIELMIVVVIISVLAAFALPAYDNHVLRGKLLEASSNLGQIRVRAEQFFQDNRTYVGMSCTTTTPGDAKYFTYDCSVTPSGAIGSATSMAYTLRATGVAAQGTGGYTFTVDQTNAKTTVIAAPAKWTAGTYNCWISKRTSC